MARGDHLVVGRLASLGNPVYSHHGIDCGDGTVIHFAFERLRGRILRTPFTAFADGDCTWVRRYRACDAPDVVMNRAFGALEGWDPYDLLDNNCEHFATWCKTGKLESQQVEDVLRTGYPVVVGATDLAKGVPLSDVVNRTADSIERVVSNPLVKGTLLGPLSLLFGKKGGRTH